MTTHAYDALFALAGEQQAGGTGLDPAAFAALLKAHGLVESGLDPHAYRREPGPRASRGLMQVLDTTARALGYLGPFGDDATGTGGLYEPAVAIPLAARLIRQNLLAAHGNVDVAIAAYNEGIGRARLDAAALQPWRTTDPEYVSKVRAAWADAAGDFAAPPDAVDGGGNGVTDGGAVPVWLLLVGAALVGVAALTLFR